jgi:hypothetical protein
MSMLLDERQRGPGRAAVRSADRHRPTHRSNPPRPGGRRSRLVAGLFCSLLLAAALVGVIVDQDGPGSGPDTWVSASERLPGGEEGSGGRAGPVELTGDAGGGGVPVADQDPLVAVTEAPAVASVVGTEPEQGGIEASASSPAPEQDGPAVPPPDPSAAPPIADVSVMGSSTVAAAV